mmetsp:Transcript_4492/g.15570  ORF Transcript_4492/g.15570 Transcript_4492/m.15570 type:complete len:224 (-) Transcript_4492:1220-1891(-)
MSFVSNMAETYVRPFVACGLNCTSTPPRLRWKNSTFSTSSRMSESCSVGSTSTFCALSCEAASSSAFSTSSPRSSSVRASSIAFTLAASASSSLLLYSSSGFITTVTRCWLSRKLRRTSFCQYWSSASIASRSCCTRSPTRSEVRGSPLCIQERSAPKPVLKPKLGETLRCDSSIWCIVASSKSARNPSSATFSNVASIAASMEATSSDRAPFTPMAKLPSRR